MPRPMTLKQFNGLSKQDFDNGAVLDEIAAALKNRETQGEQLHKQTIALQQAIGLAQDSIPPLPGKIDEWRYALEWHSLADGD